MAAGGDTALRLTVFRAGQPIAQSAGAGDAGRLRLPSDGGPDKGGSAPAERFPALGLSVSIGAAGKK